MRWKQGRRSDNVIDKRGQSVRRGAGIGGGAIVLALVAIFLFGQDPGQVLQQITSQQRSPAPGREPTAAENEVADFVKVVLGYTEDGWGQIFARSGSQYPAPKLVLFTDSEPTACGFGTAASGPFYCPADQTVYLDLSFLDQLRRFGAAGDFALAYVIAHEVGHHIQTVTGVTNQVRSAQQRAGRTGANAIQVDMELQADCYAGVWANYANQRNLLETGDVEEGLRAAGSVGDDHLQRMSGRRISPESFTHGTSEQRMAWFRRGLETGDPQACNTFSS